MTKNKIYSYSFHDLLKARSNVKLPGEGGSIQDHVSNPDIILKVGDSYFNKDKFRNIGFEFWGGDDKLYWEKQKMGIKIKLLIKNIKKNPTIIRISRSLYHILNIFPKINLGNLLTKIVDLKLLRKNHTSLHAACVSKDNKGILIPAWDDMGKTGTVLSLMTNEDYSLLSEDSTVVNSDGYAFAIPSISISPHSNRKDLDVGLLEKMKMKMKFNLFKLFPLDFLGKEKFPPQAFGDIKEKTEVNNLFVLNRGEEKVLKIGKSSSLNYIENSTYRAFYNHSWVNSLFYAYSYLNDLDLEKIRRERREVIRKFLRGIDTYELQARNSQKYSELIEKWRNK